MSHCLSDSVAGGDAVTAWLKRLAPESLVDVSVVSAEFANYVSLFGEKKSMTTTSLSPSGAGLFKVRSMGASVICMVHASKWLAHCVKEDPKVSLAAALQKLESVEAPPDAVPMYKTYLPQQALLWIPPGMLVCEQTEGEGPLWYGLRQSYFSYSGQAMENLKAIHKMMTESMPASAPALQNLKTVIGLYEKSRAQ
eukprot:4140419-Amphidinium_carterae.2